MEYNDPYYTLLSAGFVCLINLIALAGLSLSYSRSKQAYLALACAATIVEVLRLVPDTLLVSYPESNTIYIVSFFSQFTASLLLLCSLVRAESRFKRADYHLIGLLALTYFGSAAYQLSAGYPQSTLDWYIVSGPSILIVAVIVWKIVRATKVFSAGRTLLLLSTLSLLVVRAWLPAIETIDLLYLVYYMEVLLFPVVITALGLTEIESMHGRVKTLLDEQTQSMEDLQFILDNSLDIILVVDNVGLLQSWNRRAESVFGYSEEQTKGKIHIDELFSGNFCHKNVDIAEELEATMENVDGASFAVTVRLKTIYRGAETYSIYVINEETTLRQITAQLAR